VEKGIVYQSNVIHTGDFQVWTNMSMWMQSSFRYCNFIKHIPTGSVQNAQDYLDLVEINTTSYYFVTTFTQLSDDGCNPDNNPTNMLHAFAITGCVLSIIWWVYGLMLLLVKCCEELPELWLSVFRFGTFFLVISTIVLWLSSNYSYCVMGRGCMVEGSGLTLLQWTGTFSNMTCGESECKIQWS
jgi:hypothetical protein